MQNRNTIIVLIAIPCLLIAGVLYVRRAPTPRPSTTSLAKPIATAVPLDPTREVNLVGRKIPLGADLDIGCDVEMGHHAWRRVAWLSNHELLGIGAGDKVVRVDIAKNTVTPLPGLTQRIGGLLGNAAKTRNAGGGNYNIRVSPDGKWLLLLGPSASTNNAISIDGLQVVPLTSRIDNVSYSPYYGVGGQIPCAWLADNLHWVEMGVHDKNGKQQWAVILHDTERPKWSKVSLSTDAPPDSAGSVPDVIGMDDGHVILVNDLFSTKWQFCLLNPISARFAMTGVSGTPPGVWAHLIPAPNGKKIAVIRDADGNVPGTPASGQAANRKLGIWVSDTDGASAKLAAWTTVQKPEEIHVFWAPDSKQLLVCGANDSWLVPVK